MSTVSLVVSSYNQLEFLKIALASATGQTQPYDEIIVIDDASSDTSPEFLRKWEQEAGNRRVVLLEENLGLGQVRNLGYDQVKTDYAAVLDGDDWLFPEARANIEDVLKDRQPDVLVFRTKFYSQAEDKYMDTPHGSTFYSQDAFSMGTLKTAQEREALFRMIPTMWPKVHRMAFLRSNNMKCPYRTYEDIVWHHQCAVLANEIHCVNEPMVNYRMHKGSILGQKSAMHLKLIEVMDACEEFMQTNPQAADLRRASHCYQYNLMANSLLNSPRVPEDLKPKFASEILKRRRLLDFGMDDRELEMLERLRALLS